MSGAKRKKEPDCVRCVTEFKGGKNVRVYYAVYGSRTERITKKVFDRLIRPVPKCVTERKLGGRRGAGEVPGAGHCWPMKSDALGVTTRQIETMNARNKRHGVNVEYEPGTGRAIIPDEAAYKRLRKLHGVRFNNSYY